MVITAPCPAIYSMARLAHLRGESGIRLTCSRREFRGSGRTSGSGDHYDRRSCIFARNRATTREESSLRPLQLIRNSGWAASSSRSALFGIGEPLHNLARLASRMGGPSLPLGFRASSSRRSSQLFSARRGATTASARRLCRSWRKPVGPQRVALACSPSGIRNDWYLTPRTAGSSAVRWRKELTARHPTVIAFSLKLDPSKDNVPAVVAEDSRVKRGCSAAVLSRAS